MLVKAGAARLTKLIARVSKGRLGAKRAEEYLVAAHQSIELYGEHPAVAFADLAAEVATEVRLLRATQLELFAHGPERESRYRRVDPLGLARSLPGLGEVGGPVLAACMGNPARFQRGKQLRAFTGLAPRASETGDTDRKGQPISKAGSSLLRTTLVRAADTARKRSPAGLHLLGADGRGRHRRCGRRQQAAGSCRTFPRQSQTSDRPSS
ncbi:MAG: IS110 family transposase [Actinomycetota bacterium]